ncbi:DUF192 domain-containing protein [Halomonas lysinitropha]|uniref:DUF192 domain-containing protein n=1 Tax=Halomonas lysinitropha TaxID=2607506 RepID=A0A5K1IAV2_9GAMM|nr:DUF192 domain-containing protein [Halomonas lysinitropha]VVZ95129.1 hypothetical protein HALO32_01194 [Halomonas lysinitropha]
MNTTRRHLLLGLALLPAATLLPRVLPAAGPDSGPDLEPQTLETVPLVIHGDQGPQRLEVEVARTIAERSRGLMERDHLAEQSGMLFLYDRPQSSRNGFWMYRTRIPLDIAFIDEAGHIAEIHRMTPCKAAQAGECPVTRPSVPYRAALEVNAGAFEAMGVAAGDCVSWPGDGGLCAGAPAS